MSERPKPPVRAPLIPIDRPIVDDEGRPTLDFWRSIEALRARLGGAEDLPYILGAAGDSSAAQIQAIADEVSKLRADVLALRAVTETGQELEDLRAKIAVVQSAVDQVLSLPRGIDIVTDGTVSPRADVKLWKLLYPRQSAQAVNTDITGALYQNVAEITLRDAGASNLINLRGSSIQYNSDVTRNGGDAASTASAVAEWQFRVSSSTPVTTGNSNLIVEGTDTFTGAAPIEVGSSNWLNAVRPGDLYGLSQTGDVHIALFIRPQTAGHTLYLNGSDAGTGTATTLSANGVADIGQ